jgi:transposase
MDLAVVYRAIVRKHFPHAVIVADRFHVIRLAQLVVLGETLHSWSEEIVRMWRFTRSNRITEGFHNKMETMSRQAYGFRNFENYRLRVKVLCG